MQSRPRCFDVSMWCVPTVLAASLLHSQPSFAQQSDVEPTEPRPARQIEVVRPRKIGANAETKTDQVSATAPGLIPVPQEMLDANRDLARTLSAESRDSFRRGLMSLDQYAVHLEVALELRLAGLDPRANADERLAALNDHATLWREAAELLEDFKQPAAQGWAADVATAQLMAARAEFAAQDTGEPPGDELAALAQRMFQLRTADFKVGRASVEQMLGAASLTAQQTGSPELFDQFAEQLETDMLRFETKGAGIGRSDQVDLVRFHKEMFSAELAEDAQTQAAALRQSQDIAEHMFSVRSEYIGTGTSDLFELTQAWRAIYLSNSKLRELGDGTLKEEDRISPETLENLANKADLIQDLRGRNAANVTLVRAMQRFHAMDAWQESERAGKPVNEKPAIRPAATERQRVFNLKTPADNDRKR